MTAPASAMAQGNRRNQMLPFRRGTRRRFATIGSFAWTPGTPIPSIVIPQVGYLSRVFLRLTGTITQSGAGTVNPLGYAALFSRIRLSANLGSASIVDTSGIGLETVNTYTAPNSLPVQNTYANAGAANPVEYGLIVPVNANQRRQFEFGLIGLQAPEVRVTLDVFPASLATFVSLTTASALSLQVAYEYWEYPDPARYTQPPLTIVRTLEDAPLLITVTGDQIYQIPRLGTMAEMHSLVLINGARAVLQSNGATPPQVSEIRMRINKTDTFMDYLVRMKELDEAEVFNTPGATRTFLQQGVLSWDLWHASEQKWNGGDGRDMINTEEITTLESIVTIDPTVTLTGVCQIQPIRRVFQRLT